MKVGDKIQIPKNCYNYNGGLEALETTAVREANEINQNFLYIREITDKEIYVSVKRYSYKKNWSSFYINDIKLYSSYIEIY